MTTGAAPAVNTAGVPDMEAPLPRLTAAGVCGAGSAWLHGPTVRSGVRRTVLRLLDSNHGRIPAGLSTRLCVE